MSEWTLVSDGLPDRNRRFRFKRSDGEIFENAHYSSEGNFYAYQNGFSEYGWVPGTPSYNSSGKVNERAHSWQYTDLDVKTPEPKAPVSEPLNGTIVIEALYSREIKPVEIVPDPLAKPRADFRHALIGGSILYIIGRILQHWSQ